MGSGTFTASSFASYSVDNGRSYNFATNRIDSDYNFVTKRLKEGMNPKLFDIRECVNSEEHPNTIPIILGLDVTGSMGLACEETAKALGNIVAELYEEIPDVEFCIMGIGDLECDLAPVQMSQFESDVRIAKSIDDLYMEHGGGGNGYESYTIAWYMGLRHTKLDCYDKQSRKGIIITMGDEPLNPILHTSELKKFIGDNVESDIITKDLYNETLDKFDIYHISVDDRHSSYDYRKSKVDKSWEILGENYKVSTIDDLSRTIKDCIKASVLTVPNESDKEISW